MSSRCSICRHPQRDSIDVSVLGEQRLNAGEKRHREIDSYYGDMQRGFGRYVRGGYGGAGTAARRFGETAARAAKWHRQTEPLSRSNEARLYRFLLLQSRLAKLPGPV